MDGVWVSLPTRGGNGLHIPESMPDRVRRVGQDIEELRDYYRITVSPSRHKKLRQYYSDALDALFRVDFDALDQQGRVDFLLLRNLLQRSSHELHAEWKVIKGLKSVLPFAPDAIALCEARQRSDKLDAQLAAQQLDDIATLVIKAKADVEHGNITTGKLEGYKASKYVSNIVNAIDEFASFYASYDPSFDWWVSTPLKAAQKALREYVTTIQHHLAGMREDEKNEILGEPIGREALLVDLESEMIAYTPEELLDLANDVFRWCETQMKTASNELGFEDDWKKALDYVKTRHPGPGEQTHFVKELVLEGAHFVRKHDLLTVPTHVEDTLQMTMISAQAQKQSPFFLGGNLIQVAYPTNGMSHELKKMVMRGNNKHFSRATAFHEMIPGHRMQSYYMQRYNTHRALFSSPFWTEGYAMYWELLFWNRGDFFVSPEDRIGTMFWRMHRCARIIFSLNFHLGNWEPQRCVDLLVDWVGHERSTAESEVRRSFAGDYPPLYQCGYMLGALQFWELRQEVLKQGDLKEKQYHDLMLWNGGMPVELLRAILLEKSLSPDYKPQWRFASGTP